MNRELFAQRFRETATKARDSARDFIEEDLHEEMRFRLRLNSAYDGGSLHADERVYPEDSGVDRARELQCCTEDQVVDELWRDGMVPEWIHVGVVGELGTTTLIELLCSGRFTANEDLLYHHRFGRAPFLVPPPTLPVHCEDGDRFSVYSRSSCWTKEELQHVAQNREKVWSLELYGAEFDDDAILTLPTFGGLEVLELRASPIRGAGLANLDRQRRLCILRILLDHEGSFSIEHVPPLPHLGTLHLYDLSGASVGFRSLSAKLPELDWIGLEATGEIVIDEPWPRPLGFLAIRAARVIGRPLPRSIGSLHLSLKEGDDASVGALLSDVGSVIHLLLRGTPVTDELVEKVLERWKLEYLDVVDTKVTTDCIRRIAARYPTLRMQPKLDPIFG